MAVREYTLRFEDADWFAAKKPTVTVGGVGGINSWTSLLLARAGFPLILYDDDKVEKHNLGGQLFPETSVNTLKVSAAKETIKMFVPEAQMICHSVRIEKNTRFLSDVCISGFDNMEARKTLFALWLERTKESSEGIFIDGRLSMESYQIFYIDRANNEHIEMYKKHLFEDSEVPELSCTAKATSHCGAMIASNIVGGLTNWIANTYQFKENVRAVPFQVVHDISLFNTEIYG